MKSWRDIAGDGTSNATEGKDDGQHVRNLKQQLDIWKMLAAVARADTEREAELNAALRTENDRLREAQRDARIVQLRPVGVSPGGEDELLGSQPPDGWSG